MPKFATLLLALLCIQDQDPKALIQKLGDPTPSVRQEAEAKLKLAGLAVERALQAAQKDPDPEIRMRVQRLLALCRETRRIQSINRIQRPKKLRLVSVKATDVPISAVLDQIEYQIGLSFKLKKVPSDRRVTCEANQEPLIRTLHRLGVTYDRDTLDGAIHLENLVNPKLSAYTDGIGVNFTRKPWIVEGQQRGTVIRTECIQDYFGDLEWDIATVSSEKKLKVERCGKHSPMLVFVPDADPGKIKVVVKGIRRWYSDVPVKFLAPREGHVRRVGTFEIIVGWPVLKIRSDDPVPAGILGKTLTKSDVEVKYASRVGGHFGSRLGGKRNLVARGSGGHRDLAWCGCPDVPSPVQDSAAPALAREYNLDLHSGVALWVNRPPTLDDVASISMTFHEPMEERFELTSPELK